MAVTKRTRYEVLRRDNHTCRYCGGTAPDVKITVDHVTPTALGGSDKPDNLVAACKDCNAGKSSTTPGTSLVEDVKQEDLRWAKAMVRAAETMDAESIKWKVEYMEFDDFCRFGDDNQYVADRPGSWEQTYQQFRNAGLSANRICQAYDIAMQSRIPLNRVWRNFCGVAWKIAAHRECHPGDFKKANMGRSTQCRCHGLRSCFGTDHFRKPVICWFQRL